MARLSDIIEDFIKEMFENGDTCELQIKRNELANYFSCAPSQINYVLTTRFTTEKGYYIESKRGGGGYITIKQVKFDTNKSLLEVINGKIGNSITYNSAINIIESLFQSELITQREYSLMKVAVNDRIISNALDKRNRIRANILKGMVMVLLS